MSTERTTPRPWMIRNAVIVDATPDLEGKFVGQCPLLETCPDVASNRRHVVHCVNRHEALVTALEAAKELIDDLGRSETLTEYGRAKYDKIVAILALARP